MPQMGPQADAGHCYTHLEDLYGGSSDNLWDRTPFCSQLIPCASPLPAMAAFISLSLWCWQFRYCTVEMISNVVLYDDFHSGIFETSLKFYLMLPCVNVIAHYQGHAETIGGAGAQKLKRGTWSMNCYFYYYYFGRHRWIFTHLRKGHFWHQGSKGQELKPPSLPICTCLLIITPNEINMNFYREENTKSKWNAVQNC